MDIKSQVQRYALSFV